jgi:hypothetical protein
LISWSTTMSGRTRSNQRLTWVWRTRIELTFQVAIRTPCRPPQSIEKLVPQPQEEVALGFLMAK